MTKPIARFVITAALLSTGIAAAPAVMAAPRPAAAPASAGGGGVNGIAVADMEAVVQSSAAARNAATQRAVTYKAQFTQADTRRAALQAQLQPMADKFNRDRTANAPAATLQQEYTQIQQLQESGKQELQKIVEPVALSEAYVNEQIGDKLPAAVQAAMSKAGVTLLLNPQGVVVAGPAYSLNQAILTELDAALPNASIVPPAGWLPRELRQQQQAAQQQAPARGGAAPADGR